MMPDLGKYAFEVLSAYGATLLLIAALVGLSIRSARRTRAELRDYEASRKEERDAV